jgi:hypothetical protein
MAKVLKKVSTVLIVVQKIVRRRDVKLAMQVGVREGA